MVLLHDVISPSTSLASGARESPAIFMNTGYGAFGAARLTQPPADDGEQDYDLVIRQQPHNARVAQGKEKDRKPVDPPPIVQLKRPASKDPQQHFLQSPYYFMSCTLIRGSEEREDPNPNALLGTLVSSLHRLRDASNADAGFFVFGDLSVKIEGSFRLQFSLYQMKDQECVFLNSITSAPFQVHPQKSFPGMAESTFLTRSFSDQGVRLRLRKDSRVLTTRKRNHAHAEVARKHGWDAKHEALSRQNSVTEGEITPTDRRAGAGAPTFGPAQQAYYDPAPRGAHAYGAGPADPYAPPSDHSYSYPEPPAKRSRHHSASANDIGAAYLDVHHYQQQAPPPRASFADTSPSAISLPPATSGAPAPLSHIPVSLAAQPHMSAHHHSYTTGHHHHNPHPHSHHHPHHQQPYRINTQLGGPQPLSTQQITSAGGAAGTGGAGSASTSGGGVGPHPASAGSSVGGPPSYQHSPGSGGGSGGGAGGAVAAPTYPSPTSQRSSYYAPVSMPASYHSPVVGGHMAAAAAASSSTAHLGTPTGDYGRALLPPEQQAP